VKCCWRCTLWIREHGRVNIWSRPQFDRALISMKFFLTLFFSFAVSLSAQDLAPESMIDRVFLAVPTAPRDPVLYPAISGILSDKGIRVPINVSGFPALLANAIYTWTKTGPASATMELLGEAVTSRMEITFVTSAKGTYRQIPQGNGTVVVGDISFGPLPRDLAPPLVNLSTRTMLAVGRPSIVGFVVSGDVSRRVLLRAVGPTLAQFGATAFADSPSLTVFNKEGAQIGANSGWGGAASLASVFSAVGAFALPATSKDCALVLTLEPGNYTAQVRADAGGEVLVEVYFLD